MPKWTDEQLMAINEKGKNIIVSAGAGSGKTAVLSERVLTHLKNGMHIDEMLILTFTNAAAAEMKERIRKKISKVPELKEELDVIDIASITTFDAYSLSLVKKYNHLLNVSDKVNIIDSSIIELKKNELLEKIFLEMYEKKDKKFLKLINDFCLKDDKEIFSSILNINNSLDNLYNKKEYLTSYIDVFYSDDYLNKLVEMYTSFLLRKINSLKNMVENLSYYVENPFLEKLEALLLPLLEAKDYNSIKNNAHLEKTTLPRGSAEEAKKIKKEIVDMVKEIAELTSFEYSELKDSLLKTKDSAITIIEIILKLDEKLSEFKYQNDAYEFIDISKMAISILEKFPDIREEYRDKYKEILIDEYQDTNDLQDLFVSFIENNNVYMVGDIKQSIYRFRNANPLLFKSKYDKYSKKNGGIKIDLNKNFRSRKDVAENINLIFNLIMDDEIGGADYFSSHQMVFGNTAYLDVDKEDYQMEVFNYSMEDVKGFSREETEIFLIAQDILNKVNNNYKIMDKDTLEERSVKFSDFVILIDRASSFELYKKIFEYINIPLTIYRDKSVSDSSIILLLKNIYNLIISISDENYDNSFKYSFMSVARSFLYSFSDDDILKMFVDNTFFESEIFLKCKNISDSLNELNNKEIYERIINDFCFYEKIISIGNVENNLVTIDSIFKIVTNVNDFGYSPREFLKYLEDISDENLEIKLSLNKSDSNSVKIMTIHASKGLEYHVCYFSGLYKSFNLDEVKGKFLFSSQFGFVLPYVDEGPKNTFVKTLLKEHYIYEEISEKLRLFYVALTRAREKMILVTSLSSNILAYKKNGVIDRETRLQYRTFASFLDSISDFLTPYIKNIDINEINMSKNYNFKKKSNYKNDLKIVDKIIVDEYDGDFSLKNTSSFSKKTNKLLDEKEISNIKAGLKFHSLFENFDFKNPSYDNMSEFEMKKIKAFVDTHFLDNSIFLYKEYEFIYEDDGEKWGVIDLLVEFEDHFSIVDYKLKDIRDTAYLKQIHGYKKYIESLTNKNVNTYLYSIIDENLIEL